MTITEGIVNAAIKELEDTPSGLRFTELLKRLQKALPEVNENTLFTQVSQLHVSRPSEILKPARGLFVLAKFHQVSEMIPPEKSDAVAA